MRGQRIVITRAVHQAGELRGLLRQRGARVLLYPCLAVVAPADSGPLDRALADLAAGAFDWLILTSANAAMVMAQRLQILGLAPPRAVALACVGPATAQAAQSLLGLQTRVLPQTYLAEALLPALRPLLPARLLLLQAEQARPVLREELAAAGATLTAIVAYRTVTGQGGVHLSTLLTNHQVDAITFTSASSVSNCLARLRAEGTEPLRLADVCLACIGPLTAQALREQGLAVSVQPREQTIEALVEDLEIYFRVRCTPHA
jgi:uroporphyrinogen-III synthase